MFENNSNEPSTSLSLELHLFMYEPKHNQVKV